MIGAAVSGITGGMGLLQSILGIYPPFAHLYQKAWNRKNPQLIPTVGDLLEMRFRNQMSEATFKDYCADQGFDAVFADNFYEASKRLLDARDYIALWRRGYIAETVRDEQLKMLHMDDVEISRLVRATEFFPAAPDLIRFAVREVFSPEIAEAFGLFQDLPQEYLREAERAGLPEQAAIWYWGAHWELPSAQMGMNMLHRHIIDKDRLRLLLRALDVMPGWREEIIQLSYNPLTRVDVRRMYGLGVFTTDEELNTRYEAMGFSPDDAALMTKFTKLYESEGLSGITRASITKAFKIGLLGKETMYDMFLELGLSDDVASFWVDMAEYEKALEVVEAESKDLVTQYQQGKKSIDEVRTALTEKDLPATYINDVITTAVSEESKKVRLPTKADLLDWLGKQIITEQVFFNRMKNLGFREEDVAFYLTEFSMERNTSKRKYLNIKTYLRWWLNEYISEELLRQYAKEMHIADEDLELLMMEVQE